MLRNKGLIILGALLIAGFGFGMVKLLMLRFESGDVYPYYSSLRSDPLGVKVLYESLDQCCGLNVERSYDPFTKVKNRTDTAYLDLGDRAGGVALLPGEAADDLESFVTNGGRLVITFVPYSKTEDLQKELLFSLFNLEPEDPTQKLDDLRERWGFEYFGFKLSARASENSATLHPRSDEDLPASISIHTVLYFSNLSSPWKIVYDRNGHAVVVEREMGKGSIVLSAESYFLSNEAMLRERRPELLSWIVGGKKTVLFDEYDHGVAYNPGVASLIRQFRLQWLVAGALLLAGLFVWKSMAGLTPAFREDEENESKFALSRGSGAAAGMANLLRRSISPGSIFQVCYQEWKKSQKTRYANKLGRIESIVMEEQGQAPRKRNPVEAYNRVSRILEERN